MKKIICSIIVFLSVVSAVSCGRTVRREGENFSNVSASSRSQFTISTVPVTEPITEQPHETDEKGSEYIDSNVTDQIGAPEHIEIDPYMPEGYELADSCVIEGFETVMQNPELPTGCEITALAQTLNFYGFDIDKTDLCDMFMPTDFNGYYTMDQVYLGDPRSTYGCGCNAPVIIMAASYYFTWIGSDWYAVDLTKMSLQEVFYQIDQGRPVIVWSTIDQRETHAEFQFRLGCGEDFYFNYYQHCLTVYGYDYSSGTVYAADPLEGNVQYEMNRFERIYENMGNQAVILCGNEESAGAVYSTGKEMEQILKKIQENMQKELPGIENGKED